MASIPWLADVLRGAGVQVVEEGDWRSRGRNGAFEPIGVLWHHTAFHSSASNPAPGLGTVINGRPDLAGPLCHALVDYHGVFHLVSANRANHAGESGGSGPIPAGDGNAMLIGWEIDYAGDWPTGVDQAMTTAQYNASVAATAAVLRRLGRDASYARGHRETSTTNKIDPSFIDLNTMRADVARAMSGAARSVQVVIVGADGVVYHEVRQTDGQWTGFQPLAGFDGPAQAKRVSIAGMGDGSAHVAIVAADDVVYHQIRYSNGQWSGFQSLAGAGTTAPAQGKDVAIAGLPDGSAQVVIVGTDNVVYHEARLPDGRWTGFQPLAGFDAPAQAKRVSIAGVPDGSAHVCIVAVDDVVYHQIRYSSGQWSGFQPLAGAGTTSVALGKDVAVAGLPDGSAQVVIIGTDDVVYHEARLPDGRWTGFQPLSVAGGFARAKQVGIGGVPGGVAHVAIVAADDVVYHQLRQPDGQWTGFQPLAGAGTTTPAQGRDVAIG
jgi:hypothetical protein